MSRMRGEPATRRYSLPGDRVHHIAGGFGRLVLPWSRGRWLIWFGMKKRECLPRGLRLMRGDGFHNCTATKVY